MQSIIEAIKQISSCKKIAIITHVNADADALCSAIALKRLIKKKFDKDGDNVHIDIFTDTAKIGELYEPLVKNVPINNQRFRRYELAIALDSPSIHRLGKYRWLFRWAKDKLLFDHHETCEKFARNNILVKTSSVSELIYTIFVLKRNWECSPETARLLYAGIITDTNNLKENMTVNTHKVIADLMSKDINNALNLETIRNYFFKSSTKEKMSLLQRALESLSFYEKDRIAMMKIVKQDIVETECSQDDTLGIVDYAVSMKGVDIGVIFIKQDDNSYYVSLRSKNDIDVAEVAKHFNGGGHLNVAAFQSNLPLTDLRTELINECKKQLDKFPNSDIVGDLFDEDV